MFLGLFRFAKKIVSCFLINGGGGGRFISNYSRGTFVVCAGPHWSN